MSHKLISPIENRYKTGITELFTQEKKLGYWLRVEGELSQIHAELGNIPKELADEIKNKANLKYVKLERVEQLDKEIHHDLMAMVKALSEQCKGDAGKYVHLGATSYDIEDTALALQLKDALDYIKNSLHDLLRELITVMDRTKSLVCIGRTHGQHALPTTFGMRYGVWSYEVDRHLDRINEVLNKISYGKMSGAVGTMASFGENGIEIQKRLMKTLDLKPDLISNQVIQRDRHAEVIFLTALIGQSMAKIAREFRILQRNEIAEMFEPFKSTQVGSSTMPHKRNPHKSERICSLARLLKSNVITALDNVILEDERDLTNSANERFLFSVNFILLDYIITQLIEIIKNVEFDEERIELNLNLTRGASLAEKVMINLVSRGIGRQEGHELLRTAAILAKKEKRNMKDILIAQDVIKNNFSLEEIDEMLNPHNYVGKAEELVEDLSKYFKKKYKFL
ncbi:MAG: adenylosuccinate lyase [Candidatus Hermodarchaeota archaeon]